MTRAHSQWHPTDPVPPSSYTSSSDADVASSSSGGEGAAALLSGSEGEAGSDGGDSGGYAAVKSRGAVVDEGGYMTDGAGVPTGTPLGDPPLIDMISADPVLKNTKLIAEAWDCDGLNQVCVCVCVVVVGCVGGGGGGGRGGW